MSEGINPELIEKAARAAYDCTDYNRAVLEDARVIARAALEAVADDLRAEGAAKASATEPLDENPVLTAMTEYGEAIRDDWNDFDGGTEQSIIDGWVQELRQPDSSHDIEWHRRVLGICMAGGGHWCGRWGWCDDECGCVPCAEDRRAR